jgi:predicted AAA+ superfamily ATPase
LKLNSNYIGEILELHDFNSWWKDGKVSPKLTERRRKIFDELFEYVAKRQIVLFSGLRRVGKPKNLILIFNDNLATNQVISPNYPRSKE